MSDKETEKVEKMIEAFIFTCSIGLDAPSQFSEENFKQQVVS